jgi:hypothetical protein
MVRVPFHGGRLLANARGRIALGILAAVVVACGSSSDSTQGGPRRCLTDAQCLNGFTCSPQSVCVMSGSATGGFGGSGGPPTTCGNNIAEGDESCDGADLRGMTCPAVVANPFSTGFLTCTPTCVLNVTGCKTPAGPGGQGGMGGGFGGFGATGSGGIAPTTGGAATATGGTPPVLAHKITCTQLKDATSPYSARIGDTVCSCTGDSNTGTTTYSGKQCGQGRTAGTGDTHLLCCGADGYPASNDCECYLTLKWFCSSIGNTTCACGFMYNENAGVTPITQCDNLPGSNGVPWTCCSANDQDCRCFENGTNSCPAGARIVSDCITPELAGVRIPPTACPAGRTKVTSCSVGLPVSSTGGGTGSGGSSGGGACRSDADCPGDCNGDDPVCCPSCKGSGSSTYCGQYCCGSAGCF